MGSDVEYKPNFDGQTLMLANFKNDLNAGALPVGTKTVTALSVYRKRDTDSFLQHIAELPPESTIFRDYGATNGNTYVYYIFPSAEDGASASFASNGIVSNPVTPCNWNWTLICAKKNADGYYHVDSEYAFGNNLASGDIGNGNSPTWLTNFTRYPTRQPVAVNSLSGVLTSLIGRVNGAGEYTEPAELAREIYGLSVLDADKFLKDRKGNLYRIETSAEIQMSTADNTAMQAKTVRLPWRETGSVDTVSIITTEGDAYFWNFAQSEEAKMETEDKTAYIYDNWTVEIEPDEGKLLSRATVIVDVPPAAIMDISTAQEMDALLTEENIGNAYRYTGETNGIYTNGNIYEVI